MVGARLRCLVVVNYPARWFNPTTAASYKVTVKLGYTGSGAWRGTVTLPLIRAETSPYQALPVLDGFSSYRKWETLALTWVMPRVILSADASH